MEETANSEPALDWGSILTEHLLLVYERLEDGIDLCVASMVNRNWYYSYQCPFLWYQLSVRLYANLKPPHRFPSYPIAWPRWRGYHMHLLRTLNHERFWVGTDLMITLERLSNRQMLYRLRVMIPALRETLLEIKRRFMNLYEWLKKESVVFNFRSVRNPGCISLPAEKTKEWVSMIVTQMGKIESVEEAQCGPSQFHFGNAR